MMSPKKFKTVGSIAHVIAAILSVLIFVFGIYVAISNDRVISIIVLDTFGGITGFIFSAIGLIAVIKNNTSFLFFIRNALCVTAFFSLIYAVAHAMLPYYRDFYEDSYGLKSAYYLIAGGFVILTIDSAYSVYIAHSMYKMNSLRSGSENDIEASNFKTKFDSVVPSGSRSGIQVI